MATKNTTVSENEIVKEDTIKEESVKENPIPKKKERKKYDPEDLIACKSLVSGKLNVKGPRSNFIYTWADYGDVIDVEYRDLNYLIRSKDVSIELPRIIIEDEEFLEDYSELKQKYETLYSQADLMDILNLPPAAMSKAIMELPDGVKKSLKGIVATLIESGRFDSVKKIKIIDEIFDTNLLLTLAES